MHRGTNLFRIFGISVRLHFSWWFVFILLSWSLASHYFPTLVTNQSLVIYWVMGITATLLLFVSVLLHELAHSLVAIKKKIKVESITLFFFGGVAGIGQEKMPARTEFLMAIAGPIFSVFLAGLFLALTVAKIQIHITAIFQYLATINFILAAFNMLPGFPLDGGRAFRAILHGYFKDIVKATRIATIVGKLVAGTLFFIGLLGFFQGSGGGIWFILLGGFLYFIAGASYQHAIIQDLLEHVSTSKYVKKLPIVKGSTSLAKLISKYGSSSQTLFHVKEKKFESILSLDGISRASMHNKIAELTTPLKSKETIQIHENMFSAYRKIGGKKYVVVLNKDKKITGVITPQSIDAAIRYSLLTKPRKLYKKR